jgi:short-subunit dehydrogenase
VGGDFSRETDLQAELRLIQLNVFSTVHLAKLMVKDMIARGKGRILITSSIAALMPAPFEAVYGATKAFDLSFAESLREELKDTGVTVTALLPGPTDTDFFRRAGMQDTKAAEMSSDNDPAEVARQAYDALMAGEERVVSASLKTKLQGSLARFLPEQLKAKWHRTISEPGSASG